MRRCGSAQIRDRVGQTDLLSVLLQAQLIESQGALLRVRGERLAQRVNLQLALGESFKTATP